MKRDQIDWYVIALAWIWCQPQTLVGWIMHWFFPRGVPDGWTTTIHWRKQAGLSLGPWIFVHPGATIKTLQHEYGHSIQSFILGPFYLFVVGLPSLVWASRIGRNWRLKTDVDYYYFWTEHWADKLQGIER